MTQIDLVVPDDVSDLGSNLTWRAGRWARRQDENRTPPCASERRREHFPHDCGSITRFGREAPFGPFGPFGRVPWSRPRSRSAHQRRAGCLKAPSPANQCATRTSSRRESPASMPAGASAPAERRVSFGDAPAAGNGSLGNSAYKGTDNIRVESRGGAWPVGGRRLFPALSHRAAGRLPWVRFLPPLSGRVESWRAAGRAPVDASPSLSLRAAVRLPWARFQLPPRQ